MHIVAIAFWRATLFDYLNPWSDMRNALDNTIPRVLQEARKGVQVGAFLHTCSAMSNLFPDLRSVNAKILKSVAGLAPKQLGHGRRMYSTPMHWPQSVRRRWSSERLTKVYSKKNTGEQSAVSNTNGELD